VADRPPSFGENLPSLRKAFQAELRRPPRDVSAPRAKAGQLSDAWPDDQTIALWHFDDRSFG